MYTSFKWWSCDISGSHLTLYTDNSLVSAPVRLTLTLQTVSLSVSAGFKGRGGVNKDVFEMYFSSLTLKRLEHGSMPSDV